MGWIKPEDMMPPQGLQVLLELSGHGIAENYSYHSNHDFFIGSWIEGGWLVWDCCEGDSHFSSIEVHAWMPLPKHFGTDEKWNDTHEEDMLEHPIFEDEPEWLYKGDCVYEQMTIEDFMNQNQKPKLKQKGVLGIMDYIAEYRQQCEDDCKGNERCEKCNQMLFDEIEAIIRRELKDLRLSKVTWRSPKAELPKDEKPVIVVNDDGLYAIAYLCRNEYWADEWRIMYCPYDSDIWEDGECGKIEAWAELPDVPSFPAFSLDRDNGRCNWCSDIEKRQLRIEYYWIDDEGNTASYVGKTRQVSTGIARFCPCCGRKIEEVNADAEIHS